MFGNRENEHVNQADLTVNTGKFRLWQTVEAPVHSMDAKLYDLCKQQKLQFDINQHRQIIEQVTRDAKKNLLALQNQDLTIMVSGSLAVITYFLIPLWFVSVASTAICAWNIAKRQDAHEKHQHTLKNLAQAWEWAQNGEGAEKIINDPLIIEMRRVLFPLITREDFRWITRDDLEDTSITSAVKEKISIQNHHLNDKELGLYHKIYGFNQEGISAFFKAMAYAAYFGALNLGQWVYTSANNYRNNGGISVSTNNSF
jgi:hypothetical protein